MQDVFRGKTDVFISFETFSADDVEVKLNTGLAAAYAENSVNWKTCWVSTAQTCFL